MGFNSKKPKKTQKRIPMRTASASHEKGKNEKKIANGTKVPTTIMAFLNVRIRNRRRAVNVSLVGPFWISGIAISERFAIEALTLRDDGGSFKHPSDDSC